MNLIYKSSCRNCGHVTNYSKGISLEKLISFGKECLVCREADAETHTIRHLNKVSKKIRNSSAYGTSAYGELGKLLEGTAVAALVTTLESSNNLSALFN